MAYVTRQERSQHFGWGGGGGGGPKPQMYQQKKKSRTCNLYGWASASEMYIFSGLKILVISAYIYNQCISPYYLDKTVTLRKSMDMQAERAE